MYKRPFGSDELMHYGVLKMKWGHRRYQNPDGSLTPMGRLHYGYGPSTKNIGKGGAVSGIISRQKNHSLEEYKKHHGINPNAEIKEKTDAILNNDKWLKDRNPFKGTILDPEVGKKNMSYGNSKRSSKDMSNEELQDYIKRQNLEKAYNKMQGDSGKDALDLANAITTSTNVNKHTIDKARQRDRQKQVDAYNKKIEKELKSMSDQDLQRVINRNRLEKQYSEIMMPSKQTKLDKLRDIMDVVGDVSGTAASIILVGQAAYKLSKILRP